MNWFRFVVGACLIVVCATCVVAPAAAQQAHPTVAEELSHAAHTDPEFQGTAGDPLSFDPDLAWFTLLVFLILLVVLGKFAWRPMIDALDRREQGIAHAIAEAQRNHQEAKAQLVQYEQKLANAANEVRELLDEARRDAEHTKQSILAEAKAGAEAERARALREIESATDQALKTLAERSAHLAVDLAGKVLQRQLTADDHQRLVQEAMARFPQAGASSN